MEPTLKTLAQESAFILRNFISNDGIKIVGAKEQTHGKLTQIGVDFDNPPLDYGELKDYLKEKLTPLANWIKDKGVESISFSPLQIIDFGGAHKVYLVEHNGLVLRAIEGFDVFDGRMFRVDVLVKCQ